ncbi:cyclase family protein [Acidipropionibacterium timonense]|uniref:cyclase family protein n=1 Tax=Acidipropionibacterium timonense TaxID=2161818 RepID=UPI0010309FFF|nr:cyclase family protein [Acidipropionibacterium timonense]
MFVHLSYLLDPKDNAYPGEPVVSVEDDSVISPTGKPFNSKIIHLPNHFGTHMDGPHHFNPDGADFETLPIETFAYEGKDVLVADLPHRGVPRSIVVKEDLEPFAEALRGKGLLLLRTGFEKYKFTDPHTYEYEGVSLHPDLCRWLNEEFPELRCIGMDWLSIGTPSNDLGAEAHRWLLGNYTGHVITGIEDMTLAPLGDHVIKAITLGPPRVKGVDSAQVDAIAWLED